MTADGILKSRPRRFQPYSSYSPFHPKAEFMQNKSKRPAPAHLTSAHQRYARSKVSREACARNGRLGAQATIERHGRQFFFDQWRRWKLDNPSQPEMLIIGILSTLRIEFEREWQIISSFFTLDFYLPALNKGIEIHGKIHQTLKQEVRANNDITKRELLTQAGIDCLWLTHADLEDVPRLIEKIKSFISDVH
jgi:very-short-patch-repair endonuclease